MKLVMGLVAAFVLAAAAWSDEVTAKLAGEWQMVSGEADGNQPPDEIKDSFRLKFAKDGNYTIKMSGPGGQEREVKGTYKIKADAKPMEIDLSEQRGEGTRQMTGIMELDGDKLKLCFAREGNARPTEYSGAKQGYICIELKRVK